MCYRYVLRKTDATFYRRGYLSVSVQTLPAWHQGSCWVNALWLTPSTLPHGVVVGIGWHDACGHLLHCLVVALTVVAAAVATTGGGAFR